MSVLGCQRALEQVRGCGQSRTPGAAAGGPHPGPPGPPPGEEHEEWVCVRGTRPDLVSHRMVVLADPCCWAEQGFLFPAPHAGLNLPIPQPSSFPSVLSASAPAHGCGQLPGWPRVLQCLGSSQIYRPPSAPAFLSHFSPRFLVSRPHFHPRLWLAVAGPARRERRAPPACAKVLEPLSWSKACNSHRKSQ